MRTNHQSDFGPMVFRAVKATIFIWLVYVFFKFLFTTIREHPVGVLIAVIFCVLFHHYVPVVEKSFEVHPVIYQPAVALAEVAKKAGYDVDPVKFTEDIKYLKMMNMENLSKTLPNDDHSVVFYTSEDLGRLLKNPHVANLPKEQFLAQNPEIVQEFLHELAVKKAWGLYENNKYNWNDIEKADRRYKEFAARTKSLEKWR